MTTYPIDPPVSGPGRFMVEINPDAGTARLVPMAEVQRLRVENEAGWAENSRNVESNVAWVERWQASRDALVATGYFTADEIGEDIAPRITEYATHMQRELGELFDRIEGLQQRFRTMRPRSENRASTTEADVVRDARLVPADAHDLHRDIEAIQDGLFKLRVAGLPLDDVVILAPSRGGRLRDGLFLGHRVVEADVLSCVVAWLP